MPDDPGRHEVKGWRRRRARLGCPAAGDRRKRPFPVFYFYFIFFLLRKLIEELVGGFRTPLLCSLPGSVAEFAGAVRGKLCVLVCACVCARVNKVALAFCPDWCDRSG